MTGKIVIKDKVYFEPDGIKKPNKDHYNLNELFVFESYQRSMMKYEDSKQLIEVGNVYFSKLIKVWVYRKHISHKLGVKDGQRCKAEIENNIATIIKIN